MNASLVALLTGASAVQAGAPTPRQTKPLPASKAAPGTELQELQRAWTTFARAVQRHDLATIRRLSADCIFMEAKQPRPYVSTTTFLKQQWGLVFDANTTARLLRPGCRRFNLDNEQNKALYRQSCIASPADFKHAKVQEVLMTTLDPYPAGEGEGMQKACALMKPCGDYIFCGYSTIP